MITSAHECNIKMMSRYPDKFFDLAIVDPPYGIGSDKPSKKPNKVKQKNGSISEIHQSNYIHKNWDNKPPSREYFIELKRVSKEQIIFGVNYFDFNLTGGRLVWDKLNHESDQYDCEIAYLSMTERTDIVYYMWSGMMQGETPSSNIRNAFNQIGNKNLNEKRIHPTQKPVKLYNWMLNKYAKKGFKILDTHRGSGSLDISCNDMGFDLVTCDNDKEIFDSAENRLKNHQKKTNLFNQ